MTPLLFIAVCVAGGIGAATRFVVDSAFTRRDGHVPVGLVVVNASGSFALGVVVALAQLTVLDGAMALVLGTGLLGGYTTFSAASLESVRLVVDRRWPAALAVGPGMLGLCIALAALGLAATTGIASALAPAL